MNFWSIAAIIFVILLLALCIRVAFFRKHKIFSEQELVMVRERFLDLDKRVYWDPRHAVLEGDKLLDLLLKKMGYRGTLGEKLKKAGKRLPHIQDLWDAHKLRNQIAHELDVSIEPRHAKRALKAYKSAYRTLGVYLDA